MGLGFAETVCSAATPEAVLNVLLAAQGRWGFCATQRGTVASLEQDGMKGG